VTIDPALVLAASRNAQLAARVEELEATVRLAAGALHDVRSMLPAIGRAIAATANAIGTPPWSSERAPPPTSSQSKPVDAADRCGHGESELNCGYCHEHGMGFHRGFEAGQQAALAEAAALCERVRCRTWSPRECASQIRKLAKRSHAPR